MPKICNHFRIVTNQGGAQTLTVITSDSGFKTITETIKNINSGQKYIRDTKYPDHVVFNKISSFDDYLLSSDLTVTKDNDGNAVSEIHYTSENGKGKIHYTKDTFVKSSSFGISLYENLHFVLSSKKFDRNGQRIAASSLKAGSNGILESTITSGTYLAISSINIDNSDMGVLHAIGLGCQGCQVGQGINGRYLTIFARVE